MDITSIIENATGSAKHAVRAAILLIGLAVGGGANPVPAADAPDPRELIRAAMDHWRGITSYSRMTMTIHRSDWERSFSM